MTMTLAANVASMFGKALSKEESEALNLQVAGDGKKGQMLNYAFAFVAALLTTALIYRFH